MRIRWTVPAADDLESIKNYLQQHYPHFAEPIVRTIYQRVRSLKTSPNRGRPGHRSGTRELTLSPLPYVVRCTGSATLVREVLAKRNGAKNVLSDGTLSLWLAVGAAAVRFAQPGFVLGAFCRFGSYQLNCEIGEGAMGIVYLADQTQPVRREVALKAVRQLQAFLPVGPEPPGDASAAQELGLTDGAFKVDDEIRFLLSALSTL